MTRITLALLATGWISLLQAAPNPNLLPFWQPHDQSSQVSVDHNRWQTFLDLYVVPKPDGINRVAYQKIVQDGGRDLLKTYIDSLSTIDPRKLSRAEQLPYWINLYNALTIEVVLAYPGKDSIMKMGRRFFSVGPWNDKVVSIAGVDLTLNDIEHRILRPIWKDHRIHFVVNCASLGCPNLSTKAYRPDNTEMLFASAESAYLNHPRGVKHLADGSLLLSSLFKWYIEDFGASEHDLLRYIKAHNESLGTLDVDQPPAIDYAYDWSLNSES